MIKPSKLLFTSLALLLFSLLGFIEISVETTIVQDPTYNFMFILLALSFVIGIAMYVAALLYSFIVIGTLGLGIFLLPFFYGGIGFFLFWLVQKVFPTWITVNAGFWGIVLMSVILVIIYSGGGDEK